MKKKPLSPPSTDVEVICSVCGKHVRVTPFSLLADAIMNNPNTCSPECYAILKQSPKLPKS